MKTNSLYLILIILSLSLVFAYFFFVEKPTTDEGSSIEAGFHEEDSLLLYAKRAGGVWVYDQAFAEVAEDPLGDHELLIQIDPANIEEGKLKVKISSYCYPGKADYLYFEFMGKYLRYVGASKEGEFFKLAGLDNISFYYLEEAGDTMLVYESRESGSATQERKYLRRVDKLSFESMYWACGLQSYLENFLRSGAYEVYDHRAILQLENPLFDPFRSQFSFEYLAPYMPYFPMYEEYCIRADFDIVVLQSMRRDLSSRIFGIEWKRDRIELYETDLAKNSKDGAFPIQKGPLAYSLIYLHIN